MAVNDSTRIPHLVNLKEKFRERKTHMSSTARQLVSVNSFMLTLLHHLANMMGQSAA
jgi:hypothetical protein